MKEVMRSFCFDVASGLDELDLMASRLEDYFSRHAFETFDKELQESVIGNLRKKCWPQHAKNIQGLMDLFLIEGVEPKGIAEVLFKFKNPSLLKRLTTCILIGFEIEPKSLTKRSKIFAYLCLKIILFFPPCSKREVVGFGVEPSPH